LVKWKKEAYGHYEAWAALNNVTALLTYVTFGKRMNEAVLALGGKIGRSSNKRYYANITLVQMGANGVPLLDKPEAAE
jgi:hypothetical protein